MTITFTDLMVIDSDTVSFLLTIWPDLQWQVVAAAAIGVPVLVLIWWLDPLRVGGSSRSAVSRSAWRRWSRFRSRRRSTARTSSAGHHFVSKFARSGAVALIDLAQRGVFEADAAAAGRLRSRGDGRMPAATPAEARRTSS